jgi:pimeloyl-ACP methyl ester carboxylesterase
MKSSQYIEDTRIPVGGSEVVGSFVIPKDARNVVIFSHGSGSNFQSPRNKYIANRLHKEGFATLLFDLLTENEGFDIETRFNIPLLTDRLERVTEWVREHPSAKGLGISYYGAGTGAAVALCAAAKMGNAVQAIVSGSGRPDLAMQQLLEVKAPTLLIVGSLDESVVQLNRCSFRHLAGVRKLAIVEGASHFFNEPNKLEELGHLTVSWFGKHLNKIEYA